MCFYDNDTDLGEHLYYSYIRCVDRSVDCPPHSLITVRNNIRIAQSIIRSNTHSFY